MPHSLPPGLAGLSRLLQPGQSLYLPGASAEIPALSAAFSAGELPPQALTTSYLPQINGPLDLPEGSQLTGVFALWPSGRPGWRQLPLSFGGFNRWLAAQSFDLCLLHVSPPDNEGRVSLGPAVEFTPAALTRARAVVAVINPQMPDLAGSVRMRLSDATHVLEHDGPLRSWSLPEPGPQVTAIAEHIAGLIPEGATLQFGLGAVPCALPAALCGHRRLRLHSGMLTEGVALLSQAGALDSEAPLTACFHLGPEAHYRWLASGAELLRVRPVSFTHSAAVLSALPRLHAVNTALEVDLFGQANLEQAGHRAAGGGGSAADFARAAALAPDGCSILGFEARGAEGQSRIVAELSGPVTLPRQDVDMVVTEYGRADLRDQPAEERALRLIAVAPPEARPGLEAALAARLSAC